MTYNTQREKQILNLLSGEKEKTFTIEEICDRILTEGGKSTVYRIVSRLTGEGILKKITDQRSRRVSYQYLGEKSCCEHLHLKCKNCERLIHLDKSASQTIINLLNRSGSFSLDPTEILGGLCRECKGGAY